MHSAPFAVRAVAEAMEERILHSADLMPLMAAGAGTGTATGWHSEQVQALALAPAASAARHELAFVDATLADAEQLIADLQAQRSLGRPIDVVRIEATEDGLAVIGASLANQRDVTAVHVLSHGSDGGLRLGSTTLDATTLLERADEVTAWAAALSADADLLLYGCELAAGASGRQLLQDLAALSGADVAASTDLTGAGVRGGNWALEFQLGTIESSTATSAALQANWQGLMATYTVTTTSDGIGLGLIPGSLRWAVSQANAHAGTDNIVFAVNGSFSLFALSSGDDSNAGGDLDIRDSVNVIGNGSANTVIQGNGVDRVLDLRSGTISLSGLTVQGGRSNHGAGLHIDSAVTATLDDVVVQNNATNGGGQGGGIFNHGHLTLTRSVIRANGNTSSGTEGAGIFNEKNATLIATGVEIRDNNADDKEGGGIRAEESTVVLNNVTLAGNSAKLGGGAWLKSGNYTLTNVTVSGNSADEGGGLHIEDFATLDHVTVAYNSAHAGRGGGVYDKHGNDVQVKNTLFAGNSGGNTNRALASLGYNLSDDNSAGFTGVGDRKSTAAGLSALAANGGFTRTHAIGAASAARDMAHPVTALIADQRGIGYFGGRADIGAYEYNPYGLAPTISSIANRSIDEDTALTAVAFVIGDIETAAGSLVVSVTSSNTALVPNANLVLGGSGANRFISLSPAANANSSANGGSTLITLTVSDGGNSVSTTFSVTVLAVNDAPVLVLPAMQSVDEDGVLVLSGANAPQVSDVDAGAAALRFELSTSNGLLTLGQTSGLSFVTGSGSNNASMVFNGSAAAINAALNNLRFAPGVDYNGAARIDLLVSDLGNSGSGGTQSASGTIVLNVAPVNDAPLLSLPGAQATAQPTPLAFGAAGGNAIRLSDIDAGAANVELSLSTLATGNGTLTFGSLAGLTVLAGSGSGDTAVLLRGSLANLNAALDTLTFTATAAGAARIDLMLDDLGNSGGVAARQASGAIQVSVVNDALPVLTLSRTSISHAENDTAALLDPLLTITDADHATLAEASVRIVGGLAAAEDQLLFANDGLSMGNIVGSYSAGTLSMASAGASATVAEWQSALRTVAYFNSSESPSTTARTVSLIVNDGIADGAARSFTINVTAVNDAPLLAGANPMADIDEDATDNIGTLVATLLAGQVGDVDASAATGMAVIGVDNSHGQWQYSRDGGISWFGLGGVSDGSARLLAADALSAVRFVPNADWNGSVAAGLVFRAWDQTSGSAGGIGNAALNGGTYGFSSGSASTGITVLPLNDAPLLSGANALSPIDEDDRSNAGTPVAALIAGNASDVDAAALSGIAIVGADTGSGHWQFSLDGGANWTDLGAVSSGAALLLGTDAGHGVRFVPNTDWNGSIDAGLSFRAWDRSSGIAVGRADTGNGGGTSAFSTDVFASRLDVLPLNDAPKQNEVLSDVGATAGVAMTFSLPASAFSDPDAGDGLSYGAARSDGSALPGWLTFDAQTQQFDGTPANGDAGSIVVRVTATDLAGASVYGDFNLSVASVNTAPAAGQPIDPQRATQNTPWAFAVPAGSFIDPDAGDSLSYAAALSSNAALPAWLSFDAATHTFSGTPANADVGSVVVRVTVTDTAGATASSDFVLQIDNVNDAPQLLRAIVAPPAAQDLHYDFGLSPGTFGDVDSGDSLTFSATLADGSALPAWLRFDAATQHFTGTPANADVATLVLRVRAEDAAGAATYADFDLVVLNVNDVPQLAQPISDQEVMAESVLRFTVPAATFVDADVGDSLRYAATLADGSALPAWLGFDAATLSFVAGPQQVDAGTLMVRLVATDGDGAAAQAMFEMHVAMLPAVPPPPPVPEPTDEVVPPAAPEVALTLPVLDLVLPLATAPSMPAAPVSSGAPLATAALPATAVSIGARPAAGGAEETNAHEEDRAGLGASSGPAAPALSVRPAGSRSDAVLADALVPQFGGITLSPMMQLLHGGDMQRTLDEMQRQLQQQAEARRSMMASSIAVTSGLSIGYVVWLVRGGVLVSSMLSALPAWQMIDPLPVLASPGGARKKGRGKDTNDADADVERLFEQGAGALPTPTPTPTPAQIAAAAIAAARLAAPAPAGESAGGPARHATHTPPR